MVAIPSRHKSLFLLIGVVVLQILFLAIQIRRDSQGRLIRVWTVGAVTPFERVGASGVGGIRGVWNHYFALQNAARDNERLNRENAEPTTRASPHTRGTPAKRRAANSLPTMRRGMR